jgi:hypothetical protein
MRTESGSVPPPLPGVIEPEIIAVGMGHAGPRPVEPVLRADCAERAVRAKSVPSGTTYGKFGDQVMFTRRYATAGSGVL